MSILYVYGNRNLDLDRLCENDQFMIALSLTVVSEFLSAFAALDIAGSPALAGAIGVTFHVSGFDIVVARFAIGQELMCA